jgi:hypothetical protein
MPMVETEAGQIQAKCRDHHHAPDGQRRQRIKRRLKKKESL